MYNYYINKKLNDYNKFLFKTFIDLQTFTKHLINKKKECFMRTIYDSQSRKDLDRVLSKSTESIWANWYDLNVYLIFCQDSEFNVLIYYIGTNEYRRYSYDTFEAMLRDIVNIETVMTETLLRNHKLLGDRTIMRCSVCDGGGGFSLHSKNTYRGALESTREDEAESNKIFFEKIYEYLLEYQKKVFRNITEVI